MKAEVGGHHHDALALLHDAVVDGDGGAVGEDAGQRLLVAGGAERLLDGVELLAQHRHGPADLLEDDVGAEDEDARVPEVVAVGQVARRGDHVRLLDEALHLVGLVAGRHPRLALALPLAGQPRPDLEVAVAGLGGVGPDADGDDVPLLGQPRRLGDGLAEGLGPGDVVVGREHGDDALLLAGRHVERGQPDAGGGVAGAGLDDEVPGRQLLDQLPGGGGVGGPADHVGVGRPRQRRQAPHRGGEQRLVAGQRQELLRLRLARERPEPRPRAARHDHRIDLHHALQTSISSERIRAVAPQIVRPSTS